MINWATIIIEGLAIVLSLATFVVLFIILRWIAKSKTSNSIRICPNCGSLNYVHLKKGPNDTYFVASIRGSNYYECLDCKYTGVFPLINKDKVEGFRKSLSQNKNV